MRAGIGFLERADIRKCFSEAIIVTLIILLNNPPNPELKNRTLRAGAFPSSFQRAGNRSY